MSGGGMDESLSNTISNLNELIESANTTIIGIAGPGTRDTAAAKAAYEGQKACFKKGNSNCDKDKFDEFFAKYVELLPCTDTALRTVNGTGKCDPKKVFSKIYNEQGEVTKTKVMAKLAETSSQVEDLLIVANEQMRYYNHLQDLKDKYSEAEQSVGEDVDKKVAQLKTSHRKSFYEQQQSTLIQPISSFLKYFYWAAVFVWVIVLLYKTRYSDPVNIILTLSFIAFPYVSDILIVWAFKIGTAIYSLVPTDAYLDTQ
jgi:hypothetical protein